MRHEISSNREAIGKRLFQSTINNEPVKTFSYDKSLIALSSSWPNLVADLGMHIGRFSTVLDTLPQPPLVSVNGQWVQIIGNTNLGDFTVYMPSKAAAAFLQLAHDDLDITSLEGGDAALIFEHILTGYILNFEEMLGTSIIIETITDVTRPVSANLLGFILPIDGENHACALQLGGQLYKAVEILVAPHCFPEEKQLDEKMIVHLGPVVLPARQAYLARIGEMINCGVQPSDIIKGFLMRSDGRYYPIHIEDERVEIVGELSDPVRLDEANRDNVFVTFGLGEVSLTAFQRKGLSQGSSLNVTRLPNNQANIYYQLRPFGQGHLAIHGQSLAVALDNVGAFVA